MGGKWTARGAGWADQEHPRPPKSSNLVQKGLEEGAAHDNSYRKLAPGHRNFTERVSSQNQGTHVPQDPKLPVSRTDR